MGEREKTYIVWFIVLSNVLISVLEYSTVPEAYTLHDIYNELRYIPLLVGGVAFGLRGAILAYLLSSTLYLTYIYASWTGTSLSVVDAGVHLFLGALLAFLAGFLVDREKRQRQELKKQSSLAGLGQAVAAVVHDLKNPVMTIQVFARRAREGKGDLDTAMKAINDTAENMERAVHGILDFAKPIQCHPTDQDVGNLVNNVLELCRPKAEDEGVILKKEFSEPVSVPLDALCMERALTNLVTNAIEASSKNQEVVVSVLNGSEAVVIVVTDHGQGMDEETLAHIFTPFYSKKSTGTGLGMAIAKKIIEEHEGEIAITSERGVGTEMTVTLPKVLPDKTQGQQDAH